MSKKSFSFAALIEYDNAISSLSDKYISSAQQQLSASDTEYMLQKNNCLVRTFYNPDIRYSDVIYNLKSRQIKTKEIAPDRILCKGANSYYIKIKGDNVLISTTKLISCIIVNPHDNGRFDAIYCEFETEKNNITDSTKIPIVITEDEYLKGNFAYKINRLITDRSSLKFKPQYSTALFFYLVQNEINISYMYLPSCSGWSMTESGLYFASANIVHPLIDECLKKDKYKGYAEDIKNRKLLYTNRALTDVASEYKDILPNNWKYKLLIAIRVASLLLYFFKEKNIEPDQMFIIEPTDENNAKVIIALLQTINYSSFSPIHLPFTKTDFDKISTELFSNDGIALFRDSSCLEEKTKLNTSIKLLENEMRYSDVRKSKKRQFTAIISDNPANIYVSAPAMYFNFNELDCIFNFSDIKKLQKLSGEFDFTLIQEITSNQAVMTEKINSIIDSNKISVTDEISEKINNIHILDATMVFLKEYRIINDSDIKEIHKWIISSNDVIQDNQIRIVNDFYNALNSLIHTGEIKLANQSSEPFYDETQNMAFESKGYLIIGNNVFKRLIPSKMKTTKQHGIILNALSNGNIFPQQKGSKQFNSTQENKRTLTVVMKDGKRERISVYSILTELLDVQSKSKLAVIRYVNFFYPSNQLPLSNFAPIISTYDITHTAGIQIAPDSDENFHVYVTGRSGAGKSYFLVQQALFRTKTDDKIIIFDNGGYFVRDKLEKIFKDKTNEIINKFISFHYIPKDKIPVDLFSLEGCDDSSYFQASRLYNIITAASENFGEKQINALNEGLKEAVNLIISKTLSDDSDDYYCKEICEKIINIITSDKISSLSIDDHLINIINFVKEMKMIHQTWGDFLESQKKIVVITTGKERTKIGTNLIDLMLASLYTYKTYTNTSRISVIIDEISFLNLSGSGTISKLARASRQTKISLMLASQDFMKEKLNEYIGNFNINIFFQPTDCNIVANYINLPETDISLLSNLGTGECVVAGNLYDKFKGSNCRSILSGKTAEFIGSQYYPTEISAPYVRTNDENDETSAPKKSKIKSNKLKRRNYKETMNNNKKIFPNKNKIQRFDSKISHDTQSSLDDKQKTYINVKVLVKDTTIYDLNYEHGLSFYIEYRGKKILLDAGKTKLFAENAEYMLIDLFKVDYAVLSHGHCDHSGGFTAFFEKNPTATVYARKEINERYFSGDKYGDKHEISIPDDVKACSERFTLIDKSIKISEGIYLVSHNTPALSSIGYKNNLYRLDGTTSKYIEIGDPYVADDFTHEQSLVFDTPKGLIIFNSCSHGGVENIIREAKEFCDNKPVYAYIGGFHMKKIVQENYGKYEDCIFSDDEITLLCDFIKKENIPHIYTGHCTGEIGFKKLKEHLGDRVQRLTTGLEFNL